MRDLVETTIAQVMKKQPTMKSAPTTPVNTPAVKAGTEVKDQELWGVCCQFESIFLQQMMAAMRKTIPESESMPRGYANDMYDGMMDQAIAKSGSKQAPLGLAMNMYRQLEQGKQQISGDTLSIQDIQQAADTISKLDLVDKPKLGGM